LGCQGRTVGTHRIADLDPFICREWNIDEVKGSMELDPKNLIAMKTHGGKILNLLIAPQQNETTLRLLIISLFHTMLR
jgi:hypothetical protein